jgi:DNA repair protein RadC
MSRHAFVKSKQGLYRSNGYISSEDLIGYASEILYQDLSQRPLLVDPQDAANYIRLKLALEENEQFAALFLDSQHRLITFQRLFSGTIDRTIVHPRVVVQTALSLNAAAVILAHNHPSNDCEPSISDKKITRRLIDALALVDIRVLDHFIVSRSGWTSLVQRGLL